MLLVAVLLLLLYIQCVAAISLYIKTKNCSLPRAPSRGLKSNMYAVIEFSPEQGGGLSLVNKKWLTPRKKEVFWPPYKERSQFTKSLKKSEDINTETWRLYNVKKIFYETDDYDKALAKIKLAEETSDIDTEEDTSIIKRKITKPSKFMSSDDDDEVNVRHLPAPPPIRRTLFKPVTPATTNTLLTSAATTFSTPTTSSATTAATPCSQNTDLSLLEKTAFQVLLENVLEIKNQNKIILSKITKLEHSEISKGLPTDLPVQLPVNNLEQLNDVELFLQNKNNYDLLSTYYSGLGGNTVNSKTNRILKDTLDDSLAILFNYYGRNNKKAFNHLKLSTCITDALKLTCGCTTVQVEMAVKIWLKHAPQRLKNKKGRREEPNENINISTNI